MDVAVCTALPSGLRTASIRYVSESSLSDGELIARTAARDHSAFEELHRRYARAIFGYALRRIPDRGRAEDATQESFAAVWRSASTYDPARGPGAPWLYTVARNAIVDTLRRSPAATVSDPPEIASTDAEPPEQAEASWLSWRVHRALAVLSELERPVIELAYWSGLSQSEIAEFLHLPLGTVKTRTRSGLARLADELEGELR
jgi:RNA polymerase sigma-70 factor (ECF subfamily)